MWYMQAQAAILEVSDCKAVTMANVMIAIVIFVASVFDVKFFRTLTGVPGQHWLLVYYIHMESASDTNGPWAAVLILCKV